VSSSRRVGVSVSGVATSGVFRSRTSRFHGHGEWGFPVSRTSIFIITARGERGFLVSRVLILYGLSSSSVIRQRPRAARVLMSPSCWPSDVARHIFPYFNAHVDLSMHLHCALTTSPGNMTAGMVKRMLDLVDAVLGAEDGTNGGLACCVCVFSAR